MKKQPQPGSTPPASPAAGQLQPALRRYLYFTAAVTGAVILVVEILGAKMLSPYVGTSHFVWTAQIAVTLISLAVGYYFGGWLVDRSAQLGRIYRCILGAGIYLCFTVTLAKPAAYFFLQVRLAWGALLTSLFLFFVPLTLLAAVGPFMVRVLARSMGEVGGQVGKLSALSTLGSVAGTILIGYVLIPFLPNSVTMYLTAALLMITVAGYYAGWGRSARHWPLLAIAGVFGLAWGAGGLWLQKEHQFERVDELYRGNSNFGLLQVVQRKQGDRRLYLNDYLVQNTYSVVGRKSLSLFTYLLAGLARCYTTQINDALCIGLGVGIVPMDLARSGARVDVVEINPAVVPVGQKFFDLDPQKLHIQIGDGRHYINVSRKQYDAIVLDAFLGDSSPSHLLTREAFDGMRRLLRPGGVLVINCFGSFQGDEDFFVASLDRTLKSVFKSVRIHVPGNGNVFFIGSSESELKFQHEPDLRDAPEAEKELIQAGYDTLASTDPAHGMILTDDYNPVEFYDAPNRERVRRQLAFFVKDL